MSAAIVFREGQSGNYLASLIRGDSSINFRVRDRGSSSSLHLTHVIDYEFHSVKYNPLVRILPDKKIYNAVYNNFMKKLVMEEYPLSGLAHWSDNVRYWYDRCFYNIKEYHALTTADIKNNQYVNIVNFDNLTDEEYIAEILDRHFAISMDSTRLAMVRQYKSLQLDIPLLDDIEIEMSAIVDNIPDTLLIENPWFWAYCVFKYEHNNKFTESQRLWYIDSIYKPMGKDDLIALAKQYKI